jgi:MFS transporter, DHA1 family, multidrug resistance protein
MIAPIVAPPIGGLLVAAMGWQAIFWYLALFGAASLVALLKIVPETLESSRRATAGLRVTLLDYAGLFRRGRLAWLTLSSAFARRGCLPISAHRRLCSSIISAYRRQFVA